MTPADELALIERSRAGDLDSFNRLVEAYQDRVYSVALRMVRNHATAEDLAQEAFISAYRNLRQFRGGSFRGWLLRILKNAAYDWLRRSQRHPTTSIDEDVVAFETQLVSPEVSPEQAALDSELGARISESLGTLNSEQRMAVIMIDIEGYSYEETSQAMAVSVGTVKSRLSRGRARLREELLSEPELLPSRFRPVGERGGT